MAPVTALAAVVKIVHVFIHAPIGSFQLSRSPANANNSRSRTSKQYGCQSLIASTHKTRPQARDTVDISSHHGRPEVRARFQSVRLILRAAPDASFDHAGMSPQRICERCRVGSVGCWRMTGTG